jgi:DUF4097 and DUF4098 domain-containing protein YvlB
MSLEKLKILSMLEEGKISAQEASSLLESLGTTSQNSTGHNFNTQSQDNSKQDKNISTSKVTSIGAKLDSLISDVKPYAEKYSKIGIAKTKDLIKTVSTASTKTPSASPDILKTITIEEIVLSNNKKLILNGLNGNINVKGYNGDKISLSLKIKTNLPNPSIQLNLYDDTYSLFYMESQFDEVSIDAYVPESLLSSIDILNKNGAIEISDLDTKNLDLKNINGTIRANRIKCDSIIGKTTKEPIELCKIISNYGVFENFNSLCHAELLDISNLKISTSNAKINVESFLYTNYNSYNLSLLTDNGPILLKTSTTQDIGYYLKGKSILGKINFNLPGLQTLKNDGSFYEAKSINFEDKNTKVELKLETTNDSITLN